MISFIFIRRCGCCTVLFRSLRQGCFNGLRGILNAIGRNLIRPVDQAMEAAPYSDTHDQHNSHGRRQRGHTEPPEVPGCLFLLFFRFQSFNGFLHNSPESGVRRSERFPEIFCLFHDSNTSSLQISFSLLRPRFSLDFTVPCGIRRIEATSFTSYPSM